MANPAYRADTVVKREGKDDFWLNLGVAFPHEDGEGFNLLLQALPLDGKIVLRTYKEDEEEEVGEGKVQEVGCGRAHDHPSEAVTDLRRVGINPDFWYPVAVSGDVRKKKTFAAMFAGGLAASLGALEGGAVRDGRNLLRR